MSKHPECQAQLDALRREHREVLGTLLSTMDGFEVAASVGAPISPKKMAAMTSSFAFANRSSILDASFPPASAKSGRPPPPPPTMGASALTSALAEAVSRESSVGQCRDLVIESSSGFVLMMDVPSTAHRSVLTVLCTEAAVLGRIRWAARNAREAIAQALDVQPVS